MDVICLADRVLCYHCHYVGGTYVPCLWDVGEDCEHHGTDDCPRHIYQGSMPVLFAGSASPWLLNLTQSALHSGMPRLEDRTGLMGYWLRVSRGQGGRNARMKARVGSLAAGHWAGKEIPPEEIWRVQCNIWCVELVPRPEPAAFLAGGRSGPERSEVRPEEIPEP